MNQFGVNKKNILYFGIVCTLVVYYSLRSVLLYDVLDSIRYHLNPTAELAYQYGEAHLGTTFPQRYNINRAQYYFNQALQMHSKELYLYHQLARIAFLKGNFSLAITYINMQIVLYGDKTPNSYYVRGLIEGYQENYTAAIKDYERYLKTDPRNWAAINDYAWVLIKANRVSDAEFVTAYGLTLFPRNPWLLNTNATALYEMNKIDFAQRQISLAHDSAETITGNEWLQAYPGNDPKSALIGIATLKNAIENNRITIYKTNALIP